MPKPLGAPNERGLYSVEKGGHRFWLGSERREAERRKLLLEQLWEKQRECGGWRPLTKEMGKCIAKGEKFKLDSENPHEFVNLQRDFPMVTFAVPETVDDAKEKYAQQLEEEAQSYRYTTKGQTLFQALAAYQDYIKKEYLEPDGHVTDNAKTKLDQCKQLLSYLPDCDLGKLNWVGCDELFGMLRKRPESKRYKKPMARKSCTNLIGELGRFFNWLHLQPNWNWRKPEDFYLIKRSPRELDEDIEREAADVPIFTEDQIKTLLRHALPIERLFVLLALNCAYGADQLGRLRVSHLHLKEGGVSYIRRIRRKKKTRSIHLLWQPTVDAIQWALQQRKNNPSLILILNEAGEPYWYKTKSGNRSQQIPNSWYRLVARIRKHSEFPRHGFNTLRDTSAQWVRDIAGEETASLHLAHKHQSRDENLRRYTNPARKRHFKALRKLERRLQDVFSVLAEQPPQNLISLEKIAQIKSLYAQGTPIMKIARTVGVSQGTVYLNSVN
jgi:integrase